MSSSWQQACAAWQIYSEEIAALNRHLNETQWQALMAELRGCRGKIAVTGVGTSGIAARKIAHMLACVERPAIYLNATDAAHGDWVSWMLMIC
jgi:Predicted sugar phosphate isomerase involved in capsule formation